MSLFPAYAPDGDGEGLKAKEDKVKEWSSVELEPTEEAQEAVLLASDSSDEEETPPAPALQTVAAPVEDFYLDGKADHANLGVTTLYYPGRPIYKRASVATMGCDSKCGGGDGKKARKRYYLQRTPSPTPVAPHAAERARALRQLISGNPRDEDLWLRYIDFQEEFAEAEVWRAACEEAHTRLSSPPCAHGGGARVREALQRARAASLPREALLEALAGDLANAKSEELKLEGWLRLLWTLSGVGAAGGEGEGGAGEVQRAAMGALQALTHSARAYPLILYVYGSTLRAAGLWEHLVLLLELVCAVNYPPSPHFPPPAPPKEEMLAAERRLQEAEDAVIDSGLPLSTVWVRVERLRAAAHWRPKEGGEGGEADPQRAPAAAEVQELLRAVRPSATLLMCVTMLRLAQVPLLPASEASRRACGAGAEEAPDGAGAALCALGRAMRRLEPAHARNAHAQALRGALATLLDPPHYFSDDAGYLSWVLALWEACCGWMGGERRLALVSWRLRWLHALARVAPEDEARRLRAQARKVLKLHAPREPVAFALFARIEADRGEGEGARRAALQAVRAGAGASGVPREHALFAARVLRELVGTKEVAVARWALCAAALGRALPSDDKLSTAPPPDVMQETLIECTNRCEELERRFELEAEAEAEAEEEADLAVARALTCSVGEWGAARVALMTPKAREGELARITANGYERIHQSAEALQYWESCACALATEARLKEAARQLQPLFPNNALLALACNGPVSRGSLSPRSHTAALALVLPPLLRDLPSERVARACARAAARGKGGATLSAMRLEAEVQPHRLLLAALAEHPNHKWLYVRGASWVCSEAEALGDAALERGLRAHALLHELRPLPTSTSITE